MKNNSALHFIPYGVIFSSVYYNEPTNDIEPDYPPGDKSSSRHSKPTKLIIGTFSKSIGSYTDILVETANYLLDNGFLDKSKIPLASGHKRYIINKTPTHRHGEHFTAPVKLNCGYYVEAHNTAQKQIEYSKRLLSDSSIPKHELRIE